MHILKSLYCEKPTHGKFLALCCDGSGAELFRMNDDGVSALTAHGDESIYINDLIERSFCHWVQLPDDFKLWFEHEGQL